MRFQKASAAALLAAPFMALPLETAGAQLGDILKAPKTLIDRAIEARSTADIAKDNRIVIDVNRIMADIGTIKASTEIYEQKLLITGVFSDQETHDDFLAQVKQVDGVKELFWHAQVLSDAERERRVDELLGWDDVLVLETKVGVEMVATRGVADVNFRTAADSFGTIYLMGRARSQEELDKAIATVRNTDNVSQVVSYAFARP
ncbi:MAG: BON domain-containing protein [Alphaproteobacteria bacterium]